MPRLVLPNKYHIVWLDAHIGEPDFCLQLKRTFFTHIDPESGQEIQMSDKDIDQIIQCQSEISVTFDSFHFTLKTFVNESASRMTRDLGYEFLKHGQELLEANKNKAAIERLSWSKSLFIRHAKLRFPRVSQSHIESPLDQQPQPSEELKVIDQLLAIAEKQAKEQQEIDSGDTLQLGSTRPPILFEDQPTIVIFDLNGYIADPRIDLKPFYDIAKIISNEDDLFHKLEDPNGSIITVIILPQWNHSQVQLFVQQNLLRYVSAKFFSLIFINGQAIDMRTLCGTKLIGCYSITSRILAQIRSACAKANDLNINYCQQHRLQNEIRGDIGVANLYARQIFERVNLQVAYNEQLRREIEQQLFG
ncbi:unnamed protein product [Rotaria sp. Silwood2]|nr:unnamed protein product [Rotaria sp. Silwood2]CAF4276515.1 unnamed protein product [Rotaria sp. Silwood2]